LLNSDSKFLACTPAAEVAASDGIGWFRQIDFLGALKNETALMLASLRCRCGASLNFCGESQEST
jgi:hypothetical protein